MEKEMKMYAVYARGIHPYGYMREGSNLIWRSQWDCQNDGVICNLTSRSLRWLSADGIELDKKAIANAYNRYYLNGQVIDKFRVTD